MREDKKKLIGEYLKAADRFIQASELSQAMTEVKKALDLEPGNMYALAYNQRIKAALEAQKKKEDAARVKKISEEKKAGQTPQVVASETASSGDAAGGGEEKPASVQPPVVRGDGDRWAIEELERQIERFKQEIETLHIKHQQEIAVLAEELRLSQSARKEAEEKYQALVDDAEESYRRVQELYAEVVRLNEQQRQGPPSPITGATREQLLRAVVTQLLLADTLSAEANDVMELIRSMLGFDDDEFVRLQTTVKFDIYKSALEKAWTEGYITPEQADLLTDLRKKIGISAENHFELEGELRRAKKKR